MTNKFAPLDARRHRRGAGADVGRPGARPHNAAPFYSTMVYLVRKGNPKQIKIRDDLAKPGRKVVAPNPKTSGNGRHTHLAARGYVIKKGGGEAQARDLAGKLLKNVAAPGAGGRRHRHKEGLAYH